VKPIPDEVLAHLRASLPGDVAGTLWGQVVTELLAAREALRGLLSHPVAYCSGCDPYRKAARALLPENHKEAPDA
jgi:hypothetical protein